MSGPELDTLRKYLKIVKLSSFEPW